MIMDWPTRGGCRAAGRPVSPAPRRRTTPLRAEIMGPRRSFRRVAGAHTPRGPPPVAIDIGLIPATAASDLPLDEVTLPVMRTPNLMPGAVQAPLLSRTSSRTTSSRLDLGHGRARTRGRGRATRGVPENRSSREASARPRTGRRFDRPAGHPGGSPDHHMQPGGVPQKGKVPERLDDGDAPPRVLSAHAAHVAVESPRSRRMRTASWGTTEVRSLQTLRVFTIASTRSGRSRASRRRWRARASGRRAR